MHFLHGYNSTRTTRTCYSAIQQCVLVAVRSLLNVQPCIRCNTHLHRNARNCPVIGAFSAGSSFSDSRHGALSPEASDTTPSGGKNLSPALARALAKKAKAAGQSPARLTPGDGGAPSPGALVNQSPRTPVSAAVDQQNAHHGRAVPLDEEEDLEVCPCFRFVHRTRVARFLNNQKGTAGQHPHESIGRQSVTACIVPLATSIRRLAKRVICVHAGASSSRDRGTCEARG